MTLCSAPFQPLTLVNMSGDTKTLLQGQVDMEKWQDSPEHKAVGAVAGDKEGGEHISPLVARACLPRFPVSCPSPRRVTRTLVVVASPSFHFFALSYCHCTCSF
jgi:hypothetical protein